MKKLLTVIPILVIIILIFSFGVIVGKFEIFPYRQIKPFILGIKKDSSKHYDSSRFNRLKIFEEKDKMNKAQREELKKISTLGYLQGYEKASQKNKGVVLYNPQKVQDGYTLFCSGHAPSVFLINMQGKIQYQWSLKFRKIWPKLKLDAGNKESEFYIRRAHLYPNGDLLCIFSRVGLVKIDKTSRLLWKVTARNHHDLTVSEDGTIYSLGEEFRKVSEKHPRFPYQGELIDNTILLISPSGEIMDKISIFEAFCNSQYAEYLNLYKYPSNDIFHTNSIDVVRKNIALKFAAFQENDILISIRSLSLIALIDSKNKNIKWGLSGMWRSQHQAIFLDNGNILLFDNQGGHINTPFTQSFCSELMEINPRTQEVEWLYQRARNNQKTFLSNILGYNQKLPNGNVLVTESQQGHIFEVTKNKEMVWEYYNPYRAGKEKELIATILGAKRINPRDLKFLK